MSSSTSHKRAGKPHLRVIDGGLCSGAGSVEDSALRFGDGSFQSAMQASLRPCDLAVDRDSLAGLADNEVAVLSRSVDSPALAAALEAITGSSKGDRVAVPREPDALMVATGAAVAGVDRATAERIYRAMVRLAE